MKELPPKPRILIVDDAPANISIPGQAPAADFELRIAANGDDALELVGSDPPDIILLDIVMPGMDGYEVCRRLKNDGLTRNIPVIFVTGKTSEEDEIKGLNLGAVDYLPKPFSFPIVNLSQIALPPASGLPRFNRPRNPHRSSWSSSRMVCSIGPRRTDGIGSRVGRNRLVDGFINALTPTLPQRARGQADLAD
ncbi:MAG: response regulator [Pseudomonadota bacterium]